MFRRRTTFFINDGAPREAHQISFSMANAPPRATGWTLLRQVYFRIGVITGFSRCMANR